MTTEQKHEIEIPGLPKGYRAVAYRIGVIDECCFDPKTGEILKLFLATDIPVLIVEKLQPRRIVLEETEEGQPPNESQWLLGHKIGMFNLEKKWRVVEEE